MVGSSRIRFHISPAPVESATHHKVTSPHFEPHSVERSLKEMDGAVVGVDDELAIVPIRMFVSANQKFQGELFEDVIACGLPTPTAEVPAASTWFNTQNRVNGWTYDEMGNLLQVLNGASVLRSAWYDAENRQTQAVVNGGAASNYVYDGDGRRVQSVTANGTTTYVYDAAGRLAQEYATGSPTDAGTSYLFADHLLTDARLPVRPLGLPVKILNIGRSRIPKRQPR